jgi:phospholipid/cholesterol/gamma-HCH transport system substrate-binding protein
VSRREEIAVGTTVITAGLILIIGVAWMRDFNSNANTKVWHVVFPQAGGLGKSDEVQVNGVRRGSVKSMVLHGDRVAVDLVLSGDVVLTTDSRVSIRNVGLMGEKVIAVDYSTTGRPYAEGDTIQGVYELGLGEVMASMGDVVNQITMLSADLRSVTGELTRDGRLSSTIKNFEQTSLELRKAVSENRTSLTETLKDFRAAARTTKGLTADREAELKHALDQFSIAADNMARLSTRLDSLRASLQSVTSRVERGEGTLGKLVRDDKLYADVNSSVQSLKVLIEDIKKNPKKYINLSIF